MDQTLPLSVRPLPRYSGISTLTPKLSLSCLNSSPQDFPVLHEDYEGQGRGLKRRGNTGTSESYFHHDALSISPHSREETLSGGHLRFQQVFSKRDHIPSLEGRNPGRTDYTTWFLLYLAIQLL